MNFGRITARASAVLLMAAVFVFSALAQSAAPANLQTDVPVIISPEVSADRRITFLLRALAGENVKLIGSDIPGVGSGKPMAIDAIGIWRLTIGPVPPGSYRYRFDVNGVAVIDPRNPLVSESNNNVWSLVHVPGSEFSDTQNVPHGAVAAVTYYSTALGKFRRIHVYTPPGYESGKGKFPVFYLLHGAGDCDDSWTSVGRAGFILDNLIAAKKAKPMVVVMPAGHTGPFRMGGPRPVVDDFSQEMVTDI